MMDEERRYPDPNHPRFMVGLNFRPMEEKPSPAYDTLDKYLLIITNGEFYYFELSIWNGYTWFRMDTKDEVVAWAHLPKPGTIYEGLLKKLEARRAPDES